MPSLSQALHLGDLPFPHSAFQDHATHTAGWPACLGPTAHGVPVYLKVLLHSSIMLHGAMRLPRRSMGYNQVYPCALTLSLLGHPVSSILLFVQFLLVWLAS